MTMGQKDLWRDPFRKVLFKTKGGHLSHLTGPNCGYLGYLGFDPNISQYVMNDDKYIYTYIINIDCCMVMSLFLRLGRYFGVTSVTSF